MHRSIFFNIPQVYTYQVVAMTLTDKLARNKVNESYQQVI